MGLPGLAAIAPARGQPASLFLGDVITRTIVYSYDPLYRLTAADYDDGTFFHYTYDAVGNRQTQDTLAGTDTYLNDEANELVEVNGVPYSWDDNGNLLSDGVSTYTYDHANRLSSVVQGPNSYTFAYNGLGDRLLQTVNGDLVDYTLDLNAGLTQVLSEGTNVYLYGVGRIGEDQPGGWQYHLVDSLDSVRQLSDASQGVSLTRGFQPFGGTLTTTGTGSSIFGFTAEQNDLTGLIFLRARYYDSLSGRFLTRDPSRLETNPYSYVASNPTNRTDRSGLFPIEGLLGPAAFAACFDLHSILRGSHPFISAQQAVDICKLAYSRDAWDRNWFDLGGDRPASGHDLFGWYLYQQGKESRLVFDAGEPLTQELAKSISVHGLRINTYLSGGTGAEVGDFRFNLIQQGACLTDFRQVTSFPSFPVTCVLGSFYYQIKTIQYAGREWLGFRIDNRTDLESGSHISFRFPGPSFGGSVEELILNDEIDGSQSLASVVHQSFGGKEVVSILRARERTKTGAWETGSGVTHQLGGGNLVQTYYWLEERDPCAFPSLLFYSRFVDNLRIFPWADVAGQTVPITEWGETW